MSTTFKRWRIPVTLGSVAVVLLISLLLPPLSEASGISGDRSTYLAVTAQSGRGQEEAVWIFDTRTEELIVVAWDRDSSSMRTLDRREVSRDLLTVEGSR